MYQGLRVEGLVRKRKRRPTVNVQRSRDGTGDKCSPRWHEEKRGLRLHHQGTKTRGGGEESTFNTQRSTLDVQGRSAFVETMARHVRLGCGGQASPPSLKLRRDTR